MALPQAFPQGCGCYTLTEYVGKGTYGSVYKGRSKQSSGSQSFQREIAIKKIKYAGANETEKQYATREVEVMKECDHLNIISYLDSFYEEGNSYFCIVMEYCENGNLRSYMKRQKDSMSEKTFIDLFLQICRGVEYLHSKDIVHRDLKPTNILLTADNTVKIADFGVARVLDLVIFSSLSTVGTHRYMSPEMHHMKDYDDKTDIWSLGCTAYEMATGKHAYKNESVVDLKTQLGRGQLPDFEEIPYCDAMRELIKNMLNLNSPRRPKASTLINSLSKHTPCEKETDSTSSSVKDELHPADSGYAAGGSGSIKARGRYPSESDKNYIEVSTGIQAALVKELQGAESVAEILRILRTEKDSKTQSAKIKQLVGTQKYKEIRPLIKSLKPLEDRLSKSCDFSRDSTVTSASSESS